MTEIDYCGERVRIYDKERLLIETVRFRTKLLDDQYHEIIRSFRELREELYGAKMEDYLEKFPRRDLISRTIRNEVF